MAAKRDISELTTEELAAVCADWRCVDYEPVDVAAKYNILSNALRVYAKNNEWGPPGKAVTNPKGAGRTPIYDPAYDHMVYIGCSQGGFTRGQLAQLLYVSVRTINYWLNKYESFAAAVRKGDDEYNCAVAEASLQKLIKGFAYNETTKELRPELEAYEELDEAAGKIVTKYRYVRDKLTTVKTVRKMIPPNEKAVEFLLCNRVPDRWKSVNKIEVSGPDGGPMEHSHSVDTILAAAAGRVQSKSLAERILEKAGE